eukprot:s1665_g4.t1
MLFLVSSASVADVQGGIIASPTCSVSKVLMWFSSPSKDVQGRFCVFLMEQRTQTEALGEALKVNVTLTNLDLRENNIGTAGAQALGEALKVNNTLTNLYLWQNDIGAAGALALAAGLRQNRGLDMLVLSRSSVGDEGRQALEDVEKTKKERGEDFKIYWS